MAVNGPGWSDLGLQLPPQMASVQAESWTRVTVPTERQTSELSAWPQDMEGTEKNFSNHNFFSIFCRLISLIIQVFIKMMDWFNLGAHAGDAWFEI